MSYNTRIQDIAEVIMGQSPKGEDVNDVGEGLPLLNGPTEFTSRYPVPVQYTTEGRKFAEPDDILFCVRGSTTGRMNYSDQTYAIGRGIAAIRGKNGYQTPYVRAVIERNLDRLLVAATGSTFPNVGRDLLLNFEVKTVSPDEAVRINDLLVSLEDKIELNRQINQTLEQIAQAIFKSWFVDFEPVKAKIQVKQNGQNPERAAMRAISGKTDEQLDAHGRANAAGARSAGATDQHNFDWLQQLTTTAAHFPDELVDSELGEIPMGWDCTKVGEVVNRLKYSKKYTKKQVEPFGKTPVFEQGTDILLGYHNDKPGFMASPEEPMFIFGDHTCVTHLSCEPFDISQNVIPIIGNEYPTLWVYYAVKDKQTFQEYRRHWSEFVIKDVIVPVTELAVSYTGIVTNLYKRKEQSINEINVLIQTRDTLLPKLLSGEIALDEAQTTAEAVA